MIKKVIAILLLSCCEVAAQGTGIPSALRVKTDANGYLIASAVAQTAPISNPTVFTNTRLKTDANGYLLVTIGAGGNPFFDSTCYSSTTKDTVIKEVGANDLGIYTGATNCVGGTLRFDVSATAVTSALPLILADTASLHWSDIFCYRTAAKSFQCDADGAGAALTIFNVKGPLTASGTITSNAAIVAGTSIGESTTGTFDWSGRAVMSSPGDGQWLLRNNGNTAGIVLDVTTNSTAWFKTTGLGDTAILKAATIDSTTAYQANGTPGATHAACSVAVTAITVSQGLITAITCS